MTSSRGELSTWRTTHSRRVVPRHGRSCLGPAPRRVDFPAARITPETKALTLVPPLCITVAAVYDRRQCRKRGIAGGHRRPYSSETPWSRRHFQTFAGVIGILIWRTPRCHNASTTALTIAAGAPTVADSPTPLAPKG